MRIKRSQKARICPHYQGFCYCSRYYEMCDKYNEANKWPEGLR